MTALMLSCFNKSHAMECVSYLIERGLDYSRKDKVSQMLNLESNQDGWNLLFHAVDHDCQDVVEHCLSVLKMNPNSQDVVCSRIFE